MRKKRTVGVFAGKLLSQAVSHRFSSVTTHRRNEDVRIDAFKNIGLLVMLVRMSRAVG